jgi:hypothetical protein
MLSYPYVLFALVKPIVMALLINEFLIQNYQLRFNDQVSSSDLMYTIILITTFSEWIFINFFIDLRIRVIYPVLLLACFVVYIHLNGK